MSGAKHMENKPGLKAPARLQEFENDLIGEVLQQQDQIGTGKVQNTSTGDGINYERQKKLAYAQGKIYRDNKKQLKKFSTYGGSRDEVESTIRKSLRVDTQDMDPLDAYTRKRMNILAFSAQQIGLGKVAKGNRGRTRAHLSDYGSVGY